MDPTTPGWQLPPPARRPRTLWSDLGGLWRRFRGAPVVTQLILAVLALIVVVFLFGLCSDDDGGTRVASRASTTLRTLPTTTTTTIVLPPGDDKTVRSVLDGDSFEVTDGTKIRLIGIDAPDVETSDCFSAEATARLRELLPANSNVRLVYDVTRTDRFGRTLAYVYRLPDGLFVNQALVRDGFATELATGQGNTAHAADFEAAVTEARSGNRGLWQACSTTTTTTARRTTTTEAPETTEAPDTTEVPDTTTTEPTSASTSTSSSLP